MDVQPAVDGESMLDIADRPWLTEDTRDGGCIPRIRPRNISIDRELDPGGTGI